MSDRPSSRAELDGLDELVAVLVLTWARSHDKLPPGPDGVQREKGPPSANAPPGSSGQTS
jgi:hypothetical protein